MTITYTELDLIDAMLWRDWLLLKDESELRAQGNAPGQFSRKNPSMFDEAI